MSRTLLLLHICCAPCATAVVRRLQEVYEIRGFFYNPNIFPEEEYERRREAVAQLAAAWKIPVEWGEYEHGYFLESVRGLEGQPEGGARCAVCFALRLERAAERGRQLGIPLLASTLTIGRNKPAAVINRLGREVGARHGLEFLEEDWKKRDGFKQSVELSRALGIYRQRYCGCEFSIR